jgi:hypothetical protein
MDLSKDDSALVALLQRQSDWSTAGKQLKLDIGRTRTRALYLAVVGAALSTASAQVGRASAPGAWVLGLLAAIALGLAPVVGRAATAVAVRDWTRVRSVSEALKTEVYTYLAGVAPYRGEGRRVLLLDRTRTILDGQPDLARYSSGRESKQRPLPEVHDVASYIAVRVNQQIDGYYRPRAAECRRRLTRLRGVEVSLAAFAAALAAVTGFFPDAGLGSWVAVVTTVGAAIAAHTAAQRYEFEQIEFARTADQLEDLRSRYLIDEHDENTDDEFVDKCERVISIQNEGWMAKLVRVDERA